MARSGGDGLTYWALRQGASPESQLKAESLRAKLRRRMQADRAKNQPQVEVVDNVVDMSWADNVPACPVYYPTKEEFEDPMEYIQKIAPEASQYGMCKVVSPLVASVPAGYVLTREKPGFRFTPRVQPMRLSNWDAADRHKFLISGQQYTFHEFEKQANKFHNRRFSSTTCLPPKFMEAEFWKEITNGKINIEYGSDIEGSAFSSSPTDVLGRSKWNLNNFSQLADSTLRLLETAIPGVTEPMLYIGMAFAMFAWHVEDHYLFSLNYHHCGAPKTWYGVPGYAAPHFEQVVQDHVYDKELLAEGAGLAYDLLIGKTTMFSPKLLVDHKVPVYRAVQSPGEFIITFPRGYHAGFSHGFNCSEAVNFTMGDWFPFGAAACARYELLKRIPLLSHEELLCKEAISVGASTGLITSRGKQETKQEIRTISQNGLRREHSVKVAFVRLVRFHHQVRWLLKQRGALVICRSPGFDGSVMCVLCKHMCYLAFVTCRCSTTPMCLNHPKEIRDCHCGAGRHVIVREGLEELEQVALKFEQEGAVMREAHGPPTVEVATYIDGIMTEENMLDGDDYKNYTPLGGHLLSAKECSVCPQAVPATYFIDERNPVVSVKVEPVHSIYSIGERKPVVPVKVEPVHSIYSIGERKPGATVKVEPETLLASAKRKRSLIITRKPGVRSGVESRSRRGYVEHYESPYMSTEDEDENEDEDDVEYAPHSNVQLRPRVRYIEREESLELSSDDEDDDGDEEYSPS